MVVVEQRPGRRLLAIFGALAGVVAAFVLGTEVSSQGPGGVDPDEYDVLARAHDAAETRAVAAERQLADIALAQIVDVDATEQLRLSIKEMEDDRAEIEEEVRFYRQLMAPSEAQRGLRVEKLDLIEGEGNTIDYRLLLTQVVDRHDWLRGEVNVDVIGSSQGAQQVLSLTELSDPEAYPLAFKFRYFQDFGGTLILPADFEAERVVVTAVSSGRKGKQIQKTFGWDLQRG